MNNKNRILVGCLALLLVMTVGYALFSETITINGTATAKGNFNIEAICVKGVDADLMVAAGITSDDLPEGGYSNDYCNVNENNVNFGADLAFPSAIRYFTIIMTNNGTIPAQLNIDTGITSDVEVCQQDICTSFRAEFTNEQYDFFAPYYFSAELVGFKNTNGEYVVDENEINNFYDESGKNIILKPGESLVVLSSSFWDRNNPLYSENTNAGDYKTIGTFNYNFVQITQ